MARRNKSVTTNQEPKKEEKKPNEEVKTDSAAIPYEARVFEALTGVTSTEEETS